MERQDTEERDELIEKAQKLQKKRDELKKQVNLYKDSDPDVIRKEKEEIEVRKLTVFQ